MLVGGHGKYQCSCGALIMQCRCMEGHKHITIVPNGCEQCKATANRIITDSYGAVLQAAAASTRHLTSVQAATMPRTRCAATRKSTGAHCTRWAVPGSTKCWIHGGASARIH